ncbi:cadmium-translocating P-type ATPase [Polymorphobacter arshaanensis]|uniref:Cadmium-translocating P-type ATPase n=1 Tax=Glacieibacterium arshaanense TaxID=2511025 RepID=A0A4Y9EPI4_9SPHN|nr:heavy metal translocating P-type ATPase [Polymorphobacter arshaanensis]TFU03249.1 cadmium-translocating P-type ATPase [Polymorphobacter arshaanensis]
MNAPLPAQGLLAATPLAETSFSVPGMRCAGCISKLETGLPRTEGIVSARVNLTAKRVAIAHLPALTPPEMQAAIAGLGFEAQPLGQALASDAADDSRELLRAMAVAGFAAMNVMLLSVSVWSGATGATRELFHWLSAMIALPAVAYAGRPFFKSAWAALRSGHTNMDVPISIGVTLACALSLYETVTGGAHAYFDSAVMLLFFLLTGRWLDSVMRDRARDGVSALLRNTAPGALVSDAEGRTYWCAAAALQPGMVMHVATGERLAADGVVLDGASQFDRSLLTGESVPVPVALGALVHAGTLNLTAPVRVQVTAAGADTAIADIARLMEQAGQSKSRYVRIADRAARLYAPAVHTLALLSLVGWMIAGAGWHGSLLIAISVLIITCPCALGLAVPVAQIVAAGALMRAGVLVKDGSALERLADADAAVFDKTGTLTLGRPEPLNLDVLTPAQKSVALALAQSSRHPLSEALRRSLIASGITPATLTDITETPGTGVSARCGDANVALGRPETIAAGLACALTIGDAPPVMLDFADAMRPAAAAAVAQLAALGLPGSILSGDSVTGVAPVAAELGLPAQAAMLPQDKLEAIAALTANGAKVLMVGDGLNDGPALAAGYVSMAPASASDAGQNAADAVFLGDSLLPVATAVRVARATQRIVRQNFALAIGYNVIAVPLAIAGLVTPLIAALAMSGSSLLVIGNALRLRNAANAK